MNIIGIGLGGTNTKGALLDAESGECLARDTSPTRDGEFMSGSPASAV